MTNTTLVCIVAAHGYIELRAVGGGGYVIRLAPDTGPAVDMFISQPQLKLLAKHASELLKDAA